MNSHPADPTPEEQEVYDWERAERWVDEQRDREQEEFLQRLASRQQNQGESDK